MVFEGKQSEFPVLTRKEQVRLHEIGTPEAREQLILSISPWAVELARRMSIGGIRVPIDDLVGESLLGAIEAVDNWQPEKGALTTVVSTYSRNKMLHLLSSSAVVKLPLYLFWRFLAPTKGDSSDVMNIARKVVVEGVLSLHQEGRSLVERKPGTEVEREEVLLELRQRLETSLKLLSRREQAILRWVSQGKTPKKIAKHLKVSQQRISYLKRRAIQKLQADLGIEITASKKRPSKQKKRVSKKESNGGERKTEL